MTDKASPRWKGLLVVVLAAAAVATLVLGVRFFQARGVENARSSALAAAQEYAQKLYAWTPDTISDNTAFMMGRLTGEAKDEYERRVVDERIVEKTKSQKVVAKLTDQGSAVMENTRSTARVLLFLNQSASSGTEQEVAVNPSRQVFTMERDGGTWKVSKIEILTDETLQDAIDPDGDRENATPVPVPVPKPSG